MVLGCALVSINHLRRVFHVLPEGAAFEAVIYAPGIFYGFMFRDLAGGVFYCRNCTFCTRYICMDIGSFYKAVWVTAVGS